MASLYGYEIESDRPLSRLSESPGQLGRIKVREADLRPLEAPAELMRLIVDADWRPHYAAARLSGRALCWHSDAGTFVGDPASMEVVHRAADATVAQGAERWEDRLSSTAIPLLLGDAGGVPLHAAANLAGGRGVVICGVSGRGKSTLSAALAAAGHGSMGEDGVVIFPSHDGHAIWPGARGSLLTAAAARAIGATAQNPLDGRGRRLHDSLPCAGGSAIVGVIAFLRERGGSAVELERIGRAKTHRELIDHLLLARRMDAREFTATARVAESVNGVLVRVPDSLDAVGEAVERIAELAVSDGS